MASKNVFVVHGRNESIRKSMFAFLRSIGLHPLEWSEIVKATGKPNPYIGEVLEKGFSMAQAVVVLLTPDDEARLRKELQNADGSGHDGGTHFQPRPNVLIEAGMALGMFPERTIIVEIGSLRQITDLLGKHIVRLNNSAKQRHELAQRLETAKCDVDTSGQDWYEEGNFEPNSNEESDLSIKNEENREKLDNTKNHDSTYVGLTGGIQWLIDTGYFVKLRNLAEITEKLESGQYHYNKATISATLKNYVSKKKLLRRIKRNGTWKYIVKK